MLQCYRFKRKVQFVAQASLVQESKAKLAMDTDHVLWLQLSGMSGRSDVKACFTSVRMVPLWWVVHLQVKGPKQESSGLRGPSTAAKAINALNGRIDFTNKDLAATQDPATK